MGYYYQVYTGAGSGRGITAEKIWKHIPGRKVDSIIVGWSEEPDLYRRLRDEARNRGIQIWLWFPVLSEHNETYNFRQQINIGTGKPFGANVFDGDEKFDFCCPSQPNLSEKLLDIYEQIFSVGEFDGIFLDRIRYPSLTMGVEALFGCCCNTCLAEYEKTGLYRQDILNCYQQLQDRIKDPECQNPLGIVCYENGKYAFEDPILTRLIDLRKQKITEVVQNLAGAFRKKGLLIGVDLFPPFLAPFVGQDYVQLGHTSDFIKPMLYRFTDTPAGVHFELRAMAEAISNGNPSMYQLRLDFLRQVLGLDNDTTDFFCKELQTIKMVETQIGKRNLYIPGIELHTAENKPAVKPEFIGKNVALIHKAGYESMVACWDIMSAEPEAVNAFIQDSGGESL